MIIPIGSDFRTRGTPVGNYALILLNVVVFVFTDYVADGLRTGLGEYLKDYFALDAVRPALHQYITYQFLHGDIVHLGGNMLFLWIFGNPVCDRMGSWSYITFYLAGGVFSGFAFAAGAVNPLVGASGAIAAVTTAFLALFPRVHITMLVWMFLIFTIQIPAMILIVFKIILWDNVLAPQIYQDISVSSVAFSAHLGGYAFGFAASLALLGARALPRNQFDIMALWSRAGRRRGWKVGTATSRPVTARPINAEDLGSRPLDEAVLTPIERLREEIAARLANRNPEAALEAYTKLLELDPKQVLSASQQIEIANHLAQTRRHAQAADAYEAFLGAYPTVADAPEVRLFLGLICSRYLQQPQRARTHLQRACGELRLEAQRALAEEELRRAEAQISGPPPE